MKGKTVNFVILAEPDKSDIGTYIKLTDLDWFEIQSVPV